MGRVPGIVKWLLAPALAAFVGYRVIGPQMAGKVPLPKVVEEQVGKLAPASDPEPEAPAASPPPKVSVEARPLAESPPKEDAPKPRRKRRRRPTTSSEAPPEADPTPGRTEADPASTP